jgi:glycine oxidase
MTAPVSADVAVIGGGVVGAACARAAALRGLRTVLFEPGPDPAAASPASAGMLAAQIEPDDEALLALAIRGRETYEPLARSLKDTTGLDVGFWRDGIASVAFDESGVERLRTMAAWQRQMGLSCRWLEAREALDLWPALSPDALGALLAAEDGAIDPPLLTRALRADGERMGVSVARESVTGIVVAGGRATGVRTVGGNVPAGMVVIAAGAWSGRLAGLPRRLPVDPVRGQLALAPWPAGTPAAILYHDHAYVLARGGKAIIGSTMEHVGFDARVTPEGEAQLRAGAARLFPAFATLPFEKTWAGLRPLTPDGRPILGRDPEVAGLWYAVGHGRNGILLAALTGDVIGDLMVDKQLDFDLTPFLIDRFEALTPDT